MSNGPMQPALPRLREMSQRFGGRALIVGKGPSYAEADLAAAARERFVVGLNEVSLQGGCHAAFVIDGDILERHRERLLAGPGALLIVPRVPHRPRHIGGLVLYEPQAADAASGAWESACAGGLLRFNLGTASADAALGEEVPPYHFSAPTLAHLLAVAGFHDIQLAGVDGGTRYSSTFDPYAHKKLRSLQDSFDVQFEDLRRVRERFGVGFHTVRCEQAHVLIGAEPEQCLATEVLKWSIDSRTCLRVNYVDPGSEARALYAGGQAGTPFSFQRLYLPKLAAHRGRGVYFDSDMLVFRDVFELFNWDMGENVLLGCEPTPGRDAQFSVFLVDHQRARWDPDAVLADYRAGRLDYAAVMRDFSFAQPSARTLPMAWNSLEFHEPGETANVHFTDMGTQPWLSVFNPLAGLWCEALLQAARERAAVRQALDESCRRGWVRPSLAWQVEHQHADPWSLPRSVKALDARWLPPHAVARPGRAPRAVQLLRWRLSAQMRRWMQTRAYNRIRLARIALRKLV